MAYQCIPLTTREYKETLAELIFGERHLEYIIKEYMEHYHTERPHQGLDNEIIEPPPPGKGEIVCRERLGGLLKSYRRAA